MNKTFNWFYKFKKFYVTISLVGIFFLGGAAQRLCYFPFCINYQWQFQHYWDIFGDQIKSNDAGRFSANHKIEVIDSSFAALELDWLQLPSATKYSGLAVSEGAIFFMDQIGAFFQFDPKLQKFNHINLPPLPINIKEFKDKLRQKKAVDQIDLFGVRDIKIPPFSASKNLYVSTQMYDPEKDCVSLSLFSIDLNNPSKWVKHFTSKPCVVDYLQGMGSWGGRIQVQGKDRLLLTLGDAYLDGMHNKINLTEGSSDYGKVIQLNLEKNTTDIYARGLRNPSGICQSQFGIYTVEHGPMGGDELNFLIKGKNYGWPWVTYGVDYGTHDWPLNSKNGYHEGFEKPIFSWLPSIAPSDIYCMDAQENNPWSKDLLVSTLKEKSIYRIRLSDPKSIAYIEKIFLGKRIRSIVYSQRQIFITTDKEGLFGVINLKDSLSH